MLTEFRPRYETERLIVGDLWQRASEEEDWVRYQTPRRTVRDEATGRMVSVELPDEGSVCAIKGDLWFEGSPTQLLERCGVTCTDAKRAADLANLFDGDLAGYYYVAEASPPGSEEAIIWILGGLAAHVNALNQERGGGAKLGWKDFSRILPADYLRTFCEFKIANKFPSNFAKDIFAELLATHRWIEPHDGMPFLYWEASTMKHVYELSWDEYEALADSGKLRIQTIPYTGREYRLKPEGVLDLIIFDPRFQAVDDSEIDALIDKVLAENPKKVAAAQAKPQAVNALIGDVMKAAQGKADPSVVKDKLRERFPS